METRLRSSASLSSRRSIGYWPHTPSRMSSSHIPATRTHKLHSMATCWNGYASGTRCTVCCEHRPALAPVEGLLEPGDVELDLLLHLRGDAGSFFPVAV